jgi:hypothetical protein
MGPQGGAARYAAWEQRAHEPAVQELIREAIRRGEVRVVPGLRGGVRIILQGTQAESRAYNARPS